MRCVVTGADGFIGSHLCRLLVGAGHEVTGTGLNRKGRTSLDALGIDVRLEYGDIRDAAFVERVVNASEAQYVFHLAAVSIVRIAHGSPRRCLETNVLGTMNVLEACRDKRHVQAVVVASSDKAYGDHGPGVRYREGMPLMPQGTYEVSKACADHIAACYAREHGVPVCVVRACNVFGPGDLNWSRLVPACCRAAVRGLPPMIHAGAWDFAREWIDAPQVAQAYLTIAERGGTGEAYNVGSGWVATAGAIAEIIAGRIGAPYPTQVW